MMHPDQADRLLTQSYRTITKLQELLEQLPLLLEEIQQNTGMTTEEVRLQVQACWAEGLLVRGKLLDAQAQLHAVADIRMMTLLYGPNPCFRNPEEE